jgi:hemerythrin superfamily protein
MPILDALAKDHRALELLLDQIKATPSTEPADRVERFTQLQALLQGHSRAEEEVVYRRLQQRSPEEEKLLEAYEEHHVVDLLLQELASACPGGVAWSAKTRVLEELLRHHIREEEIALFPLISGAFDEAAQAEMEQQFRVLKHEKLEAFLAPLRRATPAFAGRAAVNVQAAAGRYARRGELYVRGALARLRS